MENDRMNLSASCGGILLAGFQPLLLRYYFTQGGAPCYCFQAFSLVLPEKSHRDRYARFSGSPLRRRCKMLVARGAMK